MILPYQVPDNDLTLNVAILLIILGILGKTPRRKLMLNNERIRLCFHLLKKPIVLNNLLTAYNKPPTNLQSCDEYSIASISKNLDPLHDSHRLKILLQHVASLNLIKVEYRKLDGFMYELSSEGVELEKQLKGQYYDALRAYALSLTHLNSISTTNLNELIDRDKGENTHEFQR
jgi:hypothetical protein